MSALRAWFKEMDGLLRGDTAREVIAARGTSPIHLGACVGAAVILGAAYGVCMGLFAVFTRTPPCWLQLLVTALKVPALFLLTLVVTFPSLYVFSALLGARLAFTDVVRVLVGATAVNLCVLAAFGPITGFFTISTSSYLFMKLLNVAFFTVAGVLGLGFLIRTLHLLEGQCGPVSPAPSTKPTGAASQAIPAGEEPPRLSSSGPGRTMNILPVWLFLYGLVGAQMGWVLRPFIGDPEQPFALFRARGANFFLALLRSPGEFVQ